MKGLVPAGPRISLSFSTRMAIQPISGSGSPADVGLSGQGVGEELVAPAAAQDRGAPGDGLRATMSASASTQGSRSTIEDSEPVRMMMAEAGRIGQVAPRGP